MTRIFGGRVFLTTEMVEAFTRGIKMLKKMLSFTISDI